VNCRKFLLYPLNVTPHGKKEPVVRTILNIDNDTQSMILLVMLQIQEFNS
jgi:hypothetical protein